MMDQKNLKIVGIVGSRNFTDYKKFGNFVDDWITKNGSIDMIVSGGCKGTDKLAERYAKEKSIKIVVYNAEWNLYGKSAGYIRNKKIVDQCTDLIAFPSKTGKGTQHTINLANNKKINVTQIYV